MKIPPYDYGFDLQETFNLAYDWEKYALQKKNFLVAISWNFPVNQEIGLMDLHDELDNFIERNIP